MSQDFSCFSEVKLSAAFFISSHTSAALYSEVAKAQNMNEGSNKFALTSRISDKFPVMVIRMSLIQRSGMMVCLYVTTS